MLALTVLILISNAREIEDYGTRTNRALQPAEVMTVDYYKFSSVGDLNVFLPVDDDTWGEFNTHQKGYVEKINLLQKDSSIAESSDFFVVQSWSSLGALKAPDFSIPYKECNSQLPFADPWVFAKAYKTQSYQFEGMDSCDNGCKVKMMEIEVDNCDVFRDWFETNDFNEPNLLNITIGHYTKECNKVLWLEQWNTKPSRNFEYKVEKELNAIRTYGSQFSIINIMYGTDP